MAIFSLNAFASPSGRNINYDEKQLARKKILICSFCLYKIRKYVSYGFPIINFCNPGVHYEKLCIYDRRGSLVGIATCYGLDDPGIESGGGGDFLDPSRPAFMSHVQRVFLRGRVAGA